MPSRINAAAWLTLLFGLGAAGCGAPKMQVPPEIAARSEVLQVTDRSSWSGSLVDESFKVGGYAVSAVDRDWNSSSGFAIGGFSRDSTSTGYQFGFQGGGQKLSGKCASKKGDNSFALGKGFGLQFKFAKLGCTCGERANAVVESSGGRLKGQLTTSLGSYRLQSIHGVEGGSEQDEPTGYRVDGEQPLAAAEVLHPGRVFLDKQLEPAEKAELTCLFAGLMLYQPPKDKDD